MTRSEIQHRTRIPVIGLKVDVCNYDSVIRHVTELAAAKAGGYVCVANVHMTMEAHDDKDFANKVNAADIVVPDGRPLFWMQKLRGEKDAAQVRGPSLMPMLMRHAEANNIKIGFYGGRPEVIEKIKENASVEFPSLDIGYAYSPPFRPLSDAESTDVIKKINTSGTQILFVGLGCPKAEHWMAEHRDNLTAVMLGVGAAFDFYAGNLAEAPGWMSKLGIEWLFRLATEPKRLWKRYLFTNGRFIWHASLELLGLRKFE